MQAPNHKEIASPTGGVGLGGPCLSLGTRLEHRHQTMVSRWGRGEDDGPLFIESKKRLGIWGKKFSHTAQELGWDYSETRVRSTPQGPDTASSLGPHAARAAATGMRDGGVRDQVATA